MLNIHYLGWGGGGVIDILQLRKPWNVDSGTNFNKLSSQNMRNQLKFEKRHGLNYFLDKI